MGVYNNTIQVCTYYGIQDMEIILLCISCCMYVMVYTIPHKALTDQTGHIIFYRLRSTVKW